MKAANKKWYKILLLYHAPGYSGDLCGACYHAYPSSPVSSAMIFYPTAHPITRTSVCVLIVPGSDDLGWLLSHTIIFNIYIKILKTILIIK